MATALGLRKTQQGNLHQGAIIGQGRKTDDDTPWSTCSEIQSPRLVLWGHFAQDERIFAWVFSRSAAPRWLWCFRWRARSSLHSEQEATL